MSETSYTSLRYEVEDAVATITLDRPEARNALDAALKRELLAAIRAVRAVTTRFERSSSRARAPRSAPARTCASRRPRMPRPCRRSCAAPTTP